MNVRQYVFSEAAVGMAMGGGATVTACVGLLCLATGKYGHALGMFVTTGCISSYSTYRRAVRKVLVTTKCIVC